MSSRLAQHEGTTLEVPGTPLTCSAFLGSSATVGTRRHKSQSIKGWLFASGLHEIDLPADSRGEILGNQLHGPVHTPASGSSQPCRTYILATVGQQCCDKPS